MDLQGLLDKWKSIVTFIVAIVAATMAIVAYAEDLKVLMRAEQNVIHNVYYQESRIIRKEDQIREDKRELKRILEDIGDDEPTPRQARDIDYLDKEILRLKKEIEEIREKLTTK